jgi:hypothetical protein
MPSTPQLTSCSREHIIRIRKCLSCNLELSPLERLGIIEKHNLATDWQNTGACFYPLDEQFGEIPRVRREAQAWPASSSRHNRARLLTY